MVNPRFYELIKHLWRGGKHGYYWTPDGPERTGDDGQTYTVSQTFWTSTGQPAKVPPIWKNAYFGVNPTHTKYGEHKKASLDDVACINALYAEFDAKDFATFEHMFEHVEQLDPPPSVIVHSGGGYHCYWLLRETVPIHAPGTAVTATPALAQHAWVRLTGGDQTVHDLARVLRIPGTLNHKYTPPAPVDIVHFDMACLYDYADLMAACDAQIQAIQDEAAQYVHTGGGAVSLSDAELLDKAMSAPTNGAQFARLWSGQHDGDHSAADQALVNLLAFWTGKDEARMDSLFRASGLYRDKWDRDSYRNSTIQRAVKGVRNVYDPTASQAYQDTQQAVAGVVDMSTGQGGKAATNGTGPKPQSNGAGPAPQAAPPPIPGWPYGIKQGRLVYNFEDKTTGNIMTLNIADFTAVITEEIIDEDGEKMFVISGEGKRGSKFSVEINASTIGEDRTLRSTLEAAVGALDPVYAGQGKHLAPAIKKLTNPQTLIQTRRYNRTGWAGDRFLIPGREPAGVRIDLNRKLPYSIMSSSDIAVGLKALEALIESIGPERTTVILSHVLTGPVAKIAGWRNERYGVMAKGLTGTFKTSVSQLFMCIFGPDFVRDERLIKWGEGATRNAIMSMATGASDMPFLIDNYKPQTGGGDRDFINLIHNILEGGEKDRLNRASQLRETKPVHTWPLMTGEDAPTSDSASLARILLINFEKQKIRQNDNLSFAQKNAKHLCAIGLAWLDWVESDAGQATIVRIAAKQDDTRAQWADYLYRRRSDLANPLRVATNLAMNELTYLLACEHPILGGLLKQFKGLHIVGLERVADDMAEGTAESLEALRFLSTLRELLATERAMLLDRVGAANGAISVSPQDRDRFIGWEDTDNSVYLLTDVTVNLIERHTKERFNSNRQLYAQLDDLGFLGHRDTGRQTKMIKINSKTHRTIHLKKEAFE